MNYECYIISAWSDQCYLPSSEYNLIHENNQQVVWSVIFPLRDNPLCNRLTEVMTLIELYIHVKEKLHKGGIIPNGVPVVVMWKFEKKSINVVLMLILVGLNSLIRQIKQPSVVTSLLFLTFPHRIHRLRKMVIIYNNVTHLSLAIPGFLK